MYVVVCWYSVSSNDNLRVFLHIYLICQEGIQPGGVAYVLLIFDKFQPHVAYKSVAYKKNLCITAGPNIDKKDT